MKVGDEVYVVPRDSRRGINKFSKVTKVGNKYFELENYGRARFFKDTLEHDGGEYTSAYQVYLSKEEYDLKVEIYQKLSKIRQLIGNFGQSSLEGNKIEMIYNILFENK